MNTNIQLISYSGLALAFFPAGLVVWILLHWSMDWRNAVNALFRMVIQLLMVGYVLIYLFHSNQAWLVLFVLSMMILVSSWIALRTVRTRRRRLYFKATLSVVVGGATTLLLVVQGVLELDPWYQPRYLIPLAGMIFAGVMNSISLAADRIVAEVDRGTAYLQARILAMNAALIPITNSLFAVGLVSLPGMMTGQILSGISPLQAVNYQIMVMLMTFGSAGIASACFLMLIKNDLR